MTSAMKGAVMLGLAFATVVVVGAGTSAQPRLVGVQPRVVDFPMDYGTPVPKSAEVTESNVPDGECHEDDECWESGQ